MISRVARRDNCGRLDDEDDAFFGCPRAMHHALWDDKALIGQELDRSPLEIDYESATQDVKKLNIIVVFVPVILALHYAEPHDRIVHPAKRLIVSLVGDRLCELIDIDQSEEIELYVEMRGVGKGFRFCHPQSPIVGVGELSGRPGAHARPPCVASGTRPQPHNCTFWKTPLGPLPSS
jgi:hypothetical protein